jgi:hypothetical protein
MARRMTPIEEMDDYVLTMRLAFSVFLAAMKKAQDEVLAKIHEAAGN